MKIFHCYYVASICIENFKIRIVIVFVFSLLIFFLFSFQIGNFLKWFSLAPVVLYIMKEFLKWILIKILILRKLFCNNLVFNFYDQVNFKVCIKITFVKTLKKQATILSFTNHFNKLNVNFLFTWQRL